MSVYFESISFGFAPALQKSSVFEAVELGEVNRARSTHWGIGGKGANVARMIVQLGGRVRLIGFSGGANGERYERLLLEERVKHEHVRVAGETRICHTLLQSDGALTTELVEEMQAVTAADEAAMWDLIMAADLRGVHALSGKLPAGLSDDFYARICRVIRDQGGVAIVDTQGEPLRLAWQQGPFVKLNREELTRTIGVKDVVEAGAVVLEAGACGLLVTDGANASMFFSGKECFRIEPVRVETVNPVGSGDAVTAGMVVALQRGEVLEEAVRLGMACGASNAAQAACGVIDLEQLAMLQEQVTLERV
jgi:1-phosphofructokinase family hexose kinase